MMETRYSVLVQWSDDDESYVATVPELPGCCAVCPTRQSVMMEVDYAIHAWIEAATELGREIPKEVKVF